MNVYQLLIDIMMNKNVSKIKGNNNIVQQGKENTLQTDGKPTYDNHRQFFEKANFWIGVIALLVAIIVGWNAIIKFIGKII